MAGQPPDESGPTVVCAWCSATIRQGGTSLSHGLCTSCLPAVWAEIETRAQALNPAPRSPLGSPETHPAA